MQFDSLPSCAELLVGIDDADQQQGFANPQTLFAPIQFDGLLGTMISRPYHGHKNK
jgi:hypothetical protein